jgi:hypothetical protein
MPYDPYRGVSTGLRGEGESPFVGLLQVEAA